MKEEILNAAHKKFITEKGVENIWPPNFPEAYKEAALNAMEEYGNLDKWISIDGNRPDHNGYFICWLTMPEEPGLIHYHKDTGWGNGFYNDRVTHYRIINPPKQ